MARIRTLDFLPEIFQTPTNSEFLAATLDQLVNPPETLKIQGYVGSKLGYGINATNKYVVEPTKTRTDYQLEPGVVFTKKDESIAKDAIGYTGILDSIGLDGGITDNNSQLFESQFYSWDSFVDLDKLINYNQYYWLPEGPPAVTISNSTVFLSDNFVVLDLPNSYNIFRQGSTSSATNPTLTLLRGGTYNFAVNQDTQFWIQGEPGVTGFPSTQPNLSTRNIFGVSNTGAQQGVVTFNVPNKDAQNEYNFPATTNVDLVSNAPFSQINGKRLAELANGIDGVTGINGLTVMFYNTGIENEIGYVSSYFGETNYDINSNLVDPIQVTISNTAGTLLTLTGVTNDIFKVTDPETGQSVFANPTITFSSPAIGGVIPGQVYYVNNLVGSTQFSISETLGGPTLSFSTQSGLMPALVNQGLYEEGFYTTVNQNFYRVEYVGNPNDPVLRLKPAGTIPSDTRINATFGTEFIGLGFFKNINGIIDLIPYVTANKDVLYYQDGTNPNKVGIIRLIENNVTNTLDVEADILGKKTYISNNGVTFTNGLKLSFNGDVIPRSYLTGEYYISGVGTAIELIPTSALVCPERFTSALYNPYGVEPYDESNYDRDLFVPIDKDYITIARNSISKNAWSRSNRWFHVDVIKATANYNDNAEIVNLLASQENKANRPILEFYPNLRLFQSGAVGKNPVDFFDVRQTDALSDVVGSKAYYPDVEVYTSYTSTINPVLNGTQTTITIDEADVFGIFQLGMYVGDTQHILPTNSRIIEIDGIGSGTITLTVVWDTNRTILATSNISIVGSDTTVNNYEVFTGTRMIFSNDTNLEVKNKVYIVNITEVVQGQGPVITLSLDDDSDILPEEQVVITRGYTYRGKSLYFNGLEWNDAQQKVTVNQAPLFDMFDENGISFGDSSIYLGTSFLGNKLFAYGVSDSTIDDPVLGFPVRFSSIDNVGDIGFDVSINLDTFDYVRGSQPITQKVNTGYVHNYNARTEYDNLLGWQTAIAPSTQYQVFTFPYNIFNQPSQVVCDIAMLPELTDNELGWPRIQVYYNNQYQVKENYSVNVGPTFTTVTLNVLPNNSEDTVIQVLLLSEQVSKTAYYTIPTNLANNPLNADITTANIGDIRQQYRDIFINAPDTQGELFGANNYRDLGNLVPYGTKIIQNSASLALPGAFLRNRQHDIFNALLFNSREYIKYKQLVVYTVQNSDYVQRFTPSEILDSALEEIISVKSQTNAFFWSDMLPAKSSYISNKYTFNNSLDTTIYPLSKVYNFSKANYNGLLVYLTRNVAGITAEYQLNKDVDYVVSEGSPSLTVTTDLIPGDVVVIKEYNQTYGSYVPNTPTKLGMYPAFQPQVILDENYNQPTYFIRGHDGSYTKLYGEYLPEANILIDFRDQALLELEKRIYNNLKIGTVNPIQEYDVIPGFFRETGYDWDEFLRIYSPMFLNWVGQNRIDYKIQFFNKLNEWTYNYTNSQNKLDKSPILQGYWRGVYDYLYDTTTPDTTPWEMLGFAGQPTWWIERYGPAPYTSDNNILWEDLENGYIWNNGDSYVVPNLARPGLTNLIPVNSNGELLTPLISTVGNYNPSTFQKDWKVGDMGPAELSYRRSSTWPFDLMRIYALTNTAKFFNLYADLDNYRYNEEFNQYLVNNRSHLFINDIEIYGNGIPKTSYINWIVDYEKQLGINATEAIEELLNNLDVRLIYRLAGFSDKTLLKFYVEKGSPNSENASLLIPDESYQVLLYDNPAFDQLMYSAIVVQRTEQGWSIYGNSQTFAYFTVLDPVFAGNNISINVSTVSVKLTTDYSTTEKFVPYGTIFYSLQELSQFMMSYAAWAQSKGVIFDQIADGREINWELMVQELLYWAQIGWETGSVITLNPAATELKVDRDGAVVQPLTLQQQNFILNQDLYPIQTKNLCIRRNGTEFKVEPLNEGDALSYSQFYMNNFEHIIVFDNTTLFNDTIYNLTTGLRQNRIFVAGTKSAAWNGTVNASGFIINQDNVQEWSRNLKYTRGQIVKYKNRYYSALTITGPSLEFRELDWVIVDYENIQKGMLPNASTRAYESTLYYNINKANLEQDADLLSYSLIGYRPRDYLALVDLTDTTQINVYRNLIRNKGTRNATNAFKGANLPQGGIEYDIYENWAIKTGEYGGVLNENFVEFKLSQPSLNNNPSVVSLTDGLYTPGSNQEVPIYNLYNYGRVISDPNILSTTSLTNPNPLYPNAGYVNFNDVKMASYYYSGLATAANNNGNIIPIENFYVRDYMWLANFKEKWGVYSWKPAGQVIQVSPNLNGTSTVTFAQPQSFKRLEPIAIINFAPNVNGYYIVIDVLNLNQIVIDLTLDNSTGAAIQGLGIAFSFINQRVATPSDINKLDLLEAEFIKNTVWVDENTDGSWAVYRKSINYQRQADLIFDDSVSFGTAVAYTDRMGYLISDSGAGKVYRYAYDTTNERFILPESLTGNVNFGASISYGTNIYAISEPTGATPSVHLYTLNISVLSDDMVPYQSIPAPVGATNWGTKVEISNDDNWIYISDLTNGKVYVYRKQNINLSAGYFVPGETYVVTSVGDTDWESIGATFFTGNPGYIFVATGVGSGTGTARQITFKLSTVIDGNDFGLTAQDGFGKSISTDYYGDSVLITAPNKNLSLSVQDWGEAYMLNRTVQNIEVQSDTVPNQAQIFTLGWTPVALSTTVTTTVSPNTVTLNDATGIEIDQPIIFTGTGLGGTGVATNLVYYVRSVSGNNLTLKTSRSTTTPVSVSTSSVTGVNATIQTSPLYVTVNGKLVDDINYAVVNNSLYYPGILAAGDIVNVSDNQFKLVQTFNSEYSDRTNIQFGYSSDMNIQGSDILIGSPYEISKDNSEGAVYRFSNGPAKYGMIIGNKECNLTSPATILINGYLVPLTPGNAEYIANTINQNNITNVEAVNIGNKLAIQLINKDLAQFNEKLLITSFDNTDTIDELGLTIYAQTQVIKCPHVDSPTKFGSAIKMNNGSVVITAPTATRFQGTTFDFTDDENLDNDTVFDNNSTRFVESYPNAGAAYMFDMLYQHNETISKPGQYIYAQSVNSNKLDYGLNSEYGYSVEFNNNVVMVGSPGYQPVIFGGEVSIFNNASGLKDWSEIRQSSPVVDVQKIQNAQIYSAETNNTLINLDYIDPLAGKLLGAVRSNIDYVSSADPAKYNSDLASVTGLVWGASHVGQIWFDTTNIRFMNYHQNDPVYNAIYWGKIFPGSDAAVYTWVESNVPPASYQGPGVPYDVNLFASSSVINAAGLLTPVYYFWARNTNVIYRKTNKTLADSTVSSYIANPKNSGIAYMAAILPNSFALYNCSSYINANDSVFHIGYATGNNDDVSHNEFTLIREDFPDDFLPGLPNESTNLSSSELLNQSTQVIRKPYGLYDRFLDSLSGCDETGQVVPNPYLPKTVQFGVLARPRQSFFYDRYKAINNYLQYANAVMIRFPISEIRENATFLFEKSPVIYASNNTTIILEEGEQFNTANYWEYVNWWAPGYNNNTKSSIQVPAYADLSELNVPQGTIVTVEKNGAGKFEVYILEDIINTVWTRIGLENGTIQFKTDLWNYKQAKLGFSGDFFDTMSYDSFPSEETRYIIRALNEQIYIDELLDHRNKSLILIFEYIQAETLENQNYMPWLNKTSLVDVSHTIRELLPLENLKTDNQEFLEGYIEEVKPYHVVIKDYLFKYTKTEIFEGDITDFDLPAQYNSAQQQFISPQLVYDVPSNQYEYELNDPIWNSLSYSQWYQNRGISLAGQPNYDVTTLKSYVSTNSSSMILDNANGLPINGVVKIDEEFIGYSFVDRALNMLGGLTRGVNNSVISEHIPGSNVIIDLPAVIVLDGGRGYAEPPRITAYIDTFLYPEPIEEAQFEAVMSIDSVVEIKVINPGKGYAVLPEIRIDPAYTMSFSSTDVNSSLHTISTFSPIIKTGDIVQYKASITGDGANKLLNNQWYYVGVLETTPKTILALYDNFNNAIKDQDRIPISVNSEFVGMSLNAGARAISISSAYPVRENNITLRFDRTTYNSQIIDWEKGKFYGSFFAGDYLNRESISSSSITLENTAPNINDILASSQGIPFEITDVDNERILNWSSSVRLVERTSSLDNSIRLSPSSVTFIGTGNIVGTTLNVTAISQGTVEVGTYVYSNTINPNTQILSQISGIPGGTGLYEVSISQSSSSSATVGYEINAPGTTLGFYVGMPVKFVGYSVGTIENEETYYVNSIINNVDFTITSTLGGTVYPVTSGTVAPQRLECYTGEVTDTAILTVNYPGILTVTETHEGTNILTASTTVIGTGGTQGFYPGLPVFFTDNVFGGIIENDPYYVTTVLSEQTFTLSDVDTLITTTATQTIDGTDSVIVTSTSGFSVNDSIVFQGDAFGGITVNQIYYIRDILSNTSITLSTAINGPLVSLTGGTGTLTVINQKDTVKLTTSTGAMTMNVSLPVSPGQVNGQLFTLYGTSQQYTDINTGNIDNLLERSVKATLAGVNRIAITQESGGTTNFYVNMPIRVANNIGGLSNSTTYYIVEYSGMPDPFVPGSTITNMRVIIENTSGEILTCSDDLTATPTDTLYEGMPIIFSGTSLGDVALDQIYYVKQIVNGKQFKISETLFGPTFVMTVENGFMVGTGDPYIVVSTTVPGGTPVTLTYEDNVTTSLSQYVNPVPPMFDVSYILGGYRVIIEDGSSGFAVSNTITISGDLLGGTSPYNNLVMTVNNIDEFGSITEVICEGVVPGIPNQYYLKVVGLNKLAVFSNPLMTVPVTGINFPYVGFTTTSVTQTQTSYIVVSDSSGFERNDGVVFTGTVSGGLIANKTYYIASITGNNIGLSLNPGDTAIALTVDSTANFTMAKAGSYAFLPDPFYFTPSIVKYLGRVWICLISNNDDEFIVGKWELLDSGDRRLNAMDRVMGYYAPSVNMPGADLTQLFEGVTYPNSTYKGNKFKPNEQYPIDTIIQNIPFYPDEVNLSANPVYDIQGSSFEYGYGPEELVPGAVTDNLQLTVITKSGTNWPVQIYGHYGFAVSSREYTPRSAFQTEYDFGELVQYPVSINVYVIDPTNELSYSLDNTNYIIDWINKKVILNEPLSFLPLEKLIIEVHEVGNGNQLIKTSTDMNPIRVNNVSGYNEIYLNCNYSTSLYQGRGVFRPGTQPITVEVIETESITNTIICGSVNGFVLNSPITFQGAVFGNIQEETTYYVKTVSTSTSSITVSETINMLTGVAGPTKTLSDSTGIMFANIQASTGLVWTEPLVYCNGSKLVYGATGIISKSTSATNALTTTSTGGMVINQPISFCQCVFAAGIVPFETYYIKDIIDSNEFTISTSPGGPVLELVDATGVTRFITNDYAFGTQPNGYQATIMFRNNDYRNQHDYIVYSVFGESQPEVYGYALLETEQFIANGSTSVFALSNFLGYNNIPNAIVEVDGLRLLDSQFTISLNDETIILATPPAANSVIRVTTFNDTRNQYLKTAYGLTANPGTPILSLSIGQTRHTEISFDELASPTGTPPAIAGTFIIGQTYVIASVGTTDFTLIGAASNTVGQVFTATGSGVGTGTAYVGYDAPSQIPASTFNANELVVGNDYEITLLGDTDWNDVTGSTGFDVDGNPVVWVVGDIITVVNTGSGTGTASTVNSAYSEELNWLVLASGDTSSFSVGDSVLFQGTPAMLGGLIEGKVYYVTQIWNSTEFVISEQIGGASVVVSNDTGLMDMNTTGITVAGIVNINNAISEPVITSATSVSSNNIQLTSVQNISIGQTIQFRVPTTGTPFGSILTNGTVYYVETVDSLNKTITIMDYEGNSISLTNGTGNMQVLVGGVPAIRITTSIPHALVTNNLVRLDGIVGSVELNSNVYYVHVIDPYIVDIYEQPFTAFTDKTNYPVTTVSSYVSGGYIWIAGTFYIYNSIANEIDNNTIMVDTIINISAGTPVYFSKIGSLIGDNIFGGIIQGQEYYIKTVTSGQITISEERDGGTLSLVNVPSDKILVSLWNQSNVDRLYVTINGYRVPSDKLTLNDYNELSILTQIVPRDVVIITSMIPTATPNEEIYINFVDTLNNGVVYRENATNVSWLTSPIYELSTDISVNDVKSLTFEKIQNSVVSAPTDGNYIIGIDADKNSILTVTVTNETTSSLISNEYYSIVIEDMSPVLKISSQAGVAQGDTVEIKVLLGGTIVINGEQIKFGSVDIENNKLLEIQRGVNGTGVQLIIPTYTKVSALSSINLLSQFEYDSLWNSDNFDTVLGDPLQVSTTSAAMFLRTE